jgi:hypothetical protein
VWGEAPGGKFFAGSLAFTIHHSRFTIHGCWSTFTIIHKAFIAGSHSFVTLNREERKKPDKAKRRKKMKTLFSTLLIAVLALGFLFAVGTGKADAWYRGPAIGFSLVVPPFGVSVGAPAPYYYPGYTYAAPPYPVYGSPYYSPYYGPYYGYYGYRHWDHRGWHGYGHGRGYGYRRY